MHNPPILFSVEGTIGRITLNRPDNRNSMDPELLPAFQEAVDRVKTMPDLRCLIITGSGNTFCGGGDFKSDFVHGTDLPLKERLLAIYQPFLEVSRLEVPVIAAMNGHAIGGGLGLALMCDLRVANQHAKYGANFARLGFSAGMAVSYVLPRLTGLPRAAELLFTGRIISGETAADLGLVNYAVPQEAVLDQAQELAVEIADNAPVAVRMIKRCLYEGMNWIPQEAIQREAAAQAQTFEMADAREGIAALLEKRKPHFKGC